MVHEVKTEVFEGPIDLLLQLITRHRVDIYEVSLAAITEEYLEVLENLDGLDLEQTTGFLVVAATLLELKSARLLPHPGEETDPQLLEERDRLLARLVELATFREAGAWLSAQLAAGEAFLGRVVGLEPHLLDLVPDPLEGLTGPQVARAAARALAPRPTVELDTSHVAPIRESVRDAIVELAARLHAVERSSFRSLCGDRRTRIEVVVRFLALLELFKAGAVDLAQADRFGDITAVWTQDVDPAVVMQEADEYAAEAGGGG